MNIKKLVCLLCLCFSSNVFALSKIISVDIIYSGGDALTKSLEQELRAKISHSRDFTMSSNQRSDLQLLIAENIKVKAIANHNQLSYKVSFISQEKILSMSAGSCWQDQIHQCADQVLRDVKIFIGQNP
jgi:hypothetical protein